VAITPNATLSGKKLLAKIVNGVKQPTVFCPFERLVSLQLTLNYELTEIPKLHRSDSVFQGHFVDYSKINDVQ
jgi:hypothetical protein